MLDNHPKLRIKIMKKMTFTYWQDEQFFIGFLKDYPDYKTQGESKEELVENLKDLLIDIESDEIPYIRHTEELEFA
jgi:predicted RNase H-like HicB family nuclease